MADRLEQIKRIKQGINFANVHVGNCDWNAAIVVQGALIEQLLAVVIGEDFDHHSDPTTVLTTSVSAYDVPHTWCEDLEEQRVAYEKGENNE